MSLRICYRNGIRPGCTSCSTILAQSIFMYFILFPFKSKQLQRIRFVLFSIFSFASTLNAPDLSCAMMCSTCIRRVCTSKLSFKCIWKQFLRECTSLLLASAKLDYIRWNGGNRAHLLRIRMREREFSESNTMFAVNSKPFFHSIGWNENEIPRLVNSHAEFRPSIYYSIFFVAQSDGLPAIRQNIYSYSI